MNVMVMGLWNCGWYNCIIFSKPNLWMNSMVLFVSLIICFFKLVFLAGTVSFFYNKSVGTIFWFIFSAKRTGPICKILSDVTKLKPLASQRPGTLPCPNPKRLLMNHEEVVWLSPRSPFSQLKIVRREQIPCRLPPYVILISGLSWSIQPRLLVLLLVVVGLCRVRLAGWLIAGWPVTSQNYYLRPVRIVFSSHNNQLKQYFSVLPNMSLVGRSEKISASSASSSSSFWVQNLQTRLHCMHLKQLFQSTCMWNWNQSHERCFIPFSHRRVGAFAST